MDELIERHQAACDRFATVAHLVAPDAWSAPTPCPEWTARDLVEHVIGFHEFLLIRPLGVRAQRPRDDPPGRWDATARTLFDALAIDGTLDRATELPGGGTSTPRTMIAALTTDVLVHTWDLGRATGVEPGLDTALCERAYAAALVANLSRDGTGIGAAFPVADTADTATKLVALYGRDPAWQPAQN